MHMLMAVTSSLVRILWHCTCVFSYLSKPLKCIYNKVDTKQIFFNGELPAKKDEEKLWECELKAILK